jgi:hypothetical protein
MQEKKVRGNKRKKRARNLNLPQDMSILNFQLPFIWTLLSFGLKEEDKKLSKRETSRNGMEICRTHTA